MSARVMGARARSIESPLWYFDFRTCDTAIDPRITFTRASADWRFNSSGVLVSVASGAPVIEFDPVTLVNKGLRVQPQRINAIRNATMLGAVAGSPGTAPTNWPMSSTGGVLTRTIVGTGTVNGISYIDVRYQFSGAGTAFLSVEQSNVIAASNAQAWTQSTWVSLVGGSLTNVSAVGSIVSEYDSGAGFLTNGVSNFTPTATLTRRTFTRTNTNASCAFVGPGLYITATGAADITLRVGLPKLELGSFATSDISTQGTQATRAADLPILMGINQTKGTLVVTGEIIGGTPSTFPWFAALTTATPNSDAIGIAWTANGGALRGGIAAGGTATLDQAGTANLTAGSAFKAAIAFDTNYGQTALGGGYISSVDTSVTVPTCDRAYLGGPTRFQETPAMYLQTFALYSDVLGPRQLLELTT